MTSTTRLTHSHPLATNKKTLKTILQPYFTIHMYIIYCSKWPTERNAICPRIMISAFYTRQYGRAPVKSTPKTSTKHTQPTVICEFIFTRTYMYIHI